MRAGMFCRHKCQCKQPLQISRVATLRVCCVTLPACNRALRVPYSASQRCGLTAEDLNRRWRAPDPRLHPVIYRTKVSIGCRLSGEGL